MSMTQELNSTDRLIQLRNGAWIDPRSITYLTALVNVRPYRQDGREYGAAVVIETRAGGQWKIPCIDVKGAAKLRDTLAVIANNRGGAPQTKVEHNYDGLPMPGDADYKGARS